MVIKKYENQKITVHCPTCNVENTVKIDPGAIVFDEALGEYRNLALHCPTCEKGGRASTTYINMNLPELDEMELEVMEELAPPAEVQARQELRKLMWENRPDLKGKDRAEEVRKFNAKNKATIDATRAAIATRKAARTHRKPE